MKISTLLLICALFLSGTAAYYSIAGLATIFASAFWPVVAMSSILEISKLVVTSWLYQKWSIIPALLKTYLTTSVVILMFITSLGIFGFLSKAHVDAGLGNIDANLKIEQIDAEIVQSRDASNRYQTQLTQLDKSINIQLDANRAAQAIAARKTQEAERTSIRTKLDQEQKTLQDLLRQKTEIKQKITLIESKVGPIKYIAEFFADGKDVDLDKAVRWMIVIIVIVFDPLAVLMLIAANVSMLREKIPAVTAETNNSTPQLRDTGPIYGQALYDASTGKIMWWAGQEWKPIVNQPSIAKPIVEQPIVEQPNIAKPIVEHNAAITTPTTASQASFVDTELITTVVTQCMDTWLSKVLNDTAQHEQKNTIEPIATQTKTDIIVDTQPELTEEDNNAAPTDEMVDNNATAIIVPVETVAPVAPAETISPDDTAHFLEHFKPTHVTYSSRKK